MAWTRGAIDHETVSHHETDGDIHITGKIDGGSNVTLVADNGSIVIDGKIDGGSMVTLTARAGAVHIGALAPDAGDKKIDGSSTVLVHARGDVTVGHKIDNNSNVTLRSDDGSIIIGGKIDHDCHVTLEAAGNVRIGESGNDAGERKIDGNCHVDARAGGTIWLADKIDGGALSGAHTFVTLRACRGISIGGKVDGGSQVSLVVNTGTITVGDKIDNGSTFVRFWPEGSLSVTNGIHGGARVEATPWEGPLDWCRTAAGILWQNWGLTFGYVTSGRIYPRSVAELATAVAAAGERPLKAVGGGWSFSDASLPFRDTGDIDRASLIVRGRGQTVDLSHVLQSLGGRVEWPLDLEPLEVAADMPVSTHYDQPLLERRVDSGPNLPWVDSGTIIDIRGLASVLQGQLPAILRDEARKRMSSGIHYFHVEAGITMADLQAVLDHQSPRLALQSSGASSGATLAGTLSTATHGGEFRWPLLVDSVRAIHLVGPGGVQWWIEGAVPVADLARLRSIYPGIDAAHFIAGSWTRDGLVPRDVLAAAVVAMGTMGVIYSVVLEVVPQYGLQQIVTTIQGTVTNPLSGTPLPAGATGWSVLLARAGTNQDELRAGNAHANQAVVLHLLDGIANGTHIASKENVYVDLAINPINLDCWITNRRRTRTLPVDSNSPGLGIFDYVSSLTRSLGANAVDTVQDNKLIGRLFDFLGWPTSFPSLNLSDTINVINQATKLVRFLTQYPHLIASALATINVQTIANMRNEAGHPARGLTFLGDMLTGFLNAIQGTLDGQNSDRTDISYKVGAMAWPDGGVPGRGIEIALPVTSAFSFLQRVLFDDILPTHMRDEQQPFIGYISIRICPPTSSLLGMQQFAPFSVMIEVVAYRSPESNVIMDRIQEALLETEGDIDAMLHWGLENDQLTAEQLRRMPVRASIASPGFTKLSAFKAVRQLLREGHTASFDNHFVTRLEL